MSCNISNLGGGAKDYILLKQITVTGTNSQNTWRGIFYTTYDEFMSAIDGYETLCVLAENRWHTSNQTYDTYEIAQDSYSASSLTLMYKKYLQESLTSKYFTKFPTTSAGSNQSVYLHTYQNYNVAVMSTIGITGNSTAVNVFTYSLYGIK